MIKFSQTKTITKPDIAFIGREPSTELIQGLRVRSVFNKIITKPFEGEMDSFYKDSIHIFNSHGMLPSNEVRPRNITLPGVRRIVTSDGISILHDCDAEAVNRNNIRFLDEDGQAIAGYNERLNYLAVPGIPKEFILAGSTGPCTPSGATELYIKIINDITNILKKEGARKRTKVKRSKKLSIGADPEWSFYDKENNRAVPADSVLKDVNRASKIGLDGASHTGEFRPSPCDDPLLLVNKELKPLLRELMAKTPSNLVVTTGGGTEWPLGGHIHFNKSLCGDEVTLLDDFIGRPATAMRGGKRASGGYGQLSDVRSQPHGCEYRTPPSTLLPGICEAQFVTAFLLVRKWEMLGPGESISYSIEENGVPTLESYLNLAPLQRLKPYLRKYYEWLTTGHYDTKQDILSAWFERKTVPTKRDKKKKPRVAVKTEQDWYKGPSKISVKGLVEQSEFEVETYSPSFLEERWEEIPNGAVIIEVPEQVSVSFEENEDLFNSFCSRLSATLSADVAIIEADTNNTAAIRIPHTWRKKRELVSPTLVKSITRQLFAS